jgi:hypothetical protein
MNEQCLPPSGQTILAETAFADLRDLHDRHAKIDAE